MESLISNATAKNWKRLKTDGSVRLTSRANKRCSKKKILPEECLLNRSNLAFVRRLVTLIEEERCKIEEAIYSLAVALLRQKGILKKEHVQQVLQKYEIVEIEKLSSLDLPQDEFDLLGVIYQSLRSEGEKNINGSYYTPAAIAKDMTAGFDFLKGETFFDPCCGSGAFLLAVKATSPLHLFGCDNDAIAVMIAEVNLLLKYSDECFIPQVFCLNYLEEAECDSVSKKCGLFERSFDYIATNPPWGGMVAQKSSLQEITTKESAVIFFMTAYKQLLEGGTISFLFPESILKIKVHKGIRSFMLKRTCIDRIKVYEHIFSGVTTKGVCITCKKSPPQQELLVSDARGTRDLQLISFYQTEDNVFSFLSPQDLSVLGAVRKKARYTLSDSEWALGIVTGDNKNKLSKICHKGWQAIGTGKDLERYLLKPPSNYLLYDPLQLQQVDKGDCYYAAEKLVYKFISKRLTFAYDNKQYLFLNSANILIPKIPNLSIKAVLAFLNSDLFQYLYWHLFEDIKILKGNLKQLPFPHLSEVENRYLTREVDGILAGDFKRDLPLQDEIYRLYGLSEKQILHIKERLAIYSKSKTLRR